LPIGGGTDMPQGAQATERFIDRIVQDAGLARARAQALLRRYGSQALRMALRFKVAGDEPLQHAPDYSVAEVAWLCTDTGVIHLDDLVIRRTLLAIRGLVTDAALAEMAGIAGQALGWDVERERQELHNCTTALRERHGVRLAPAAPGSTDAAPVFHAPLTIHPALSPS
jgi:glycerol-3-phosphate dehydrogenase